MDCVDVRHCMMFEYHLIGIWTNASDDRNGIDFESHLKTVCSFVSPISLNNRRTLKIQPNIFICSFGYAVYTDTCFANRSRINLPLNWKLQVVRFLFCLWAVLLFPYGL